ncbi:MAG: HTH-type transcriptional regulator AscG [Lentisphaerae bacterium ADurb.Bin242]|nr:MAG: HTH-type transcriptional regulator AscG [Lentisphaerae bacterium ADurb.Bin242]
MLKKPSKKLPLYRKVYDSIVEQLENNKREKISATILSREYSINRNTAEKVMDLLEANGKIRRISRKGSFPIKQSGCLHGDSINFLFTRDTFSNQFLDTYPFVNAKLIDGIYRSAASKKCDVNILLLDPASSKAELGAKFSSFGPRAGFVLLNPETMPQVLSVLRGEQFPYMAYSSVAEGNRISHDSYTASCRAVEHLVRITGRKNIAFLNPGSDFTYTGDRMRGYRDTLKKCGIPFREELVFTRPYSDTEFLAFVQSDYPGGKIDAVFSATFEIGRKAVNVLKFCGTRIPEEIAVIVYYDLPEFSMSVPSISCVNVPLEKIAASMVENLFDMINFGFRDDIRIVFKDELILRESC